MHAFVALMVVSIGAGLFSGMPLDKIAATMEKGMGGTLGFLAIVVALGAMFGKILHETGAVDQIAVKMLKSFGHSRAHYAIGLAGLICALPLFFEVAIVLLISVAFSMARHTGTNLVKLVIPLFAGVAAAAAFLLPGPAPMLLASQMHADFGWMILIGLCAAIPGMIIAGPLWGNFISRYVELNIPDDITEPHLGEGKMPSFGFSLSLILLPLVLVGLKTIAARFVPVGSTAYQWFEFVGHPFTAILVACLVAIYGLAMRQGMPKDKVMEICGHALQPAGIILLVIGAGGVFKQVLVDSGVGPALGEALTGMGLPIAITCFVLAAAVRIIQGSATVACLTAVGLVMPVIEQLNFSGAQMAALSICIAGGVDRRQPRERCRFLAVREIHRCDRSTNAEDLDNDGNHPRHRGCDGGYGGVFTAQLKKDRPGNRPALLFYPFIHIRIPSRNIWVAIITRINPIRRSSAFTPFSPSRRRNSDDCSRITNVPPQASSKAITRCPI